jgi:hypothetical protein
MSKLSWNPTSFQDVVRIVHSPGPALQYIAQAAQVMGSLSCPAPSWDPNGVYRVAMQGAGLQIQKLDVATGQWSAAPLSPPTPPPPITKG